MSAPAHVIHRRFDPAPPQVFRMERHYLLYAETGALRLEAEGRTWSLPPARAALVAAGEPVIVSLPQPVTALSVLFDPAVTPAPPAPLAVFEMTPLARELLRACRTYDDPEGPADPYAAQLFATLAATAWRLAETPGAPSMPAARSELVRRALTIAEERLAEPPAFDALSAELAVTPRTLARRLMQETGLTWRGALRRLRMIRAIERLAESDDDVTQVAFAVGYGSLSAFNAAFRALTGTTPSAYRASFRDGGAGA